MAVVFAVMSLYDLNGCIINFLDPSRIIDRNRKADTLQHVNMTIYDQTKCRHLLAEGNYELEESQLCAGGEAGRDSCFGDSGSALMADYIDGKNRFETWKLIGLVSFGLSRNKCGVQGSPGIYTRVRDYIPWILDNVET